ncbi:hypothetical protein [Pantoea stewartii]|uniref:hypothetical protein n=1 Tax=Pantoea stewartii TaxID=66269 RepID=UPI00138FA0F2|nr:hypothetical protein [Pantoea stewartii]
MKLNRFLVLPLFILMMIMPAWNVYAVAYTETLIAPPLNNNDFSVLINDYASTPEDEWNTQSFVRAGKALGSVVAGEVVID